MKEKGEGRPKIVVVGGGFGGLTALHHLHDALGTRAEITLVDRSSCSVNRPTMPEIAFAGKPAEHALFPMERATNAHQATFVQGKVESVDPRAKRVLLEGGGSLPYDYLLLTPGAVKEYDAIGGLEEFGFSICDEAHASHLWEALQTFKGGKVVIGSAPTKHGTRVKAPVLLAACEGPIGEAMFMMDFFMRERGIRQGSTIQVFSPAKIFFEDVGEEVHQAIGPFMEKAGIEVRTEKKICHVGPDLVEFEDGSSLPSDLSIVLPPHVAPGFIAKSGLGDEAGWVPTNEKMQHLDFPKIYAAGDCNALSQPKLGHIATLQAEIAAKAIAQELGAEVDVPDFKPEVLCIMNRGGHEATLILSDKVFGGARDIAVSGTLPHMMKWSFDLYYGYTHGHLPPKMLEGALRGVLDMLSPSKGKGT